MGNRMWHVSRAEYNKRAAEHLRHETEFEDWACTALFYSALHLVDSVLADNPALPKDERNPRKHTGSEPGSRGRNNLVRATFPMNVHKAYRSLEELSRRTRYDADLLSDAAQRAYDKALTQWADIEKYARVMHIANKPIPSDAP